MCLSFTSSWDKTRAFQKFAPEIMKNLKKLIKILVFERLVWNLSRCWSTPKTNFYILNLEKILELHTVCLKKRATFISSNISLVTKDIYSRFSLFCRFFNIKWNGMFEFARKKFFEAGDEKFQKQCFFQSKIFSFKWLKINVYLIFFIFFDIK